MLRCGERPAGRALAQAPRPARCSAGELRHLAARDVPRRRGEPEHCCSELVASAPSGGRFITCAKQQRGTEQMASQARRGQPSDARIVVVERGKGAGERCGRPCPAARARSLMTGRAGTPLGPCSTSSSQHPSPASSAATPCAHAWWQSTWRPSTAGGARPHRPSTATWGRWRRRPRTRSCPSCGRAAWTCPWRLEPSSSCTRCAARPRRGVRLPSCTAGGHHATLTQARACCPACWQSRLLRVVEARTTPEGACTERQPFRLMHQAARGALMLSAARRAPCASPKGRRAGVRTPLSNQDLPRPRGQHAPCWSQRGVVAWLLAARPSLITPLHD